MLVDVHSGVYAGQRPNVGPSTLIMIYSPHCRKTSFEITYGDYHVYPYDPRCNYSSLHKQPGVVTNLSPSM